MNNLEFQVLNVLFYIFLACVVVIIFGFNPLVIIASISALWLSFAFMIGSGVSQQFEGVLMVLVRQPYDVGDSIAIVSPSEIRRAAFLVNRVAHVFCALR